MSEWREWLEAIGGSLGVGLFLVLGCSLPDILDSVGLLDVAGLACLVGLAGLAAWFMWTYR